MEVAVRRPVESPLLLRVTDVKQYLYCPRIIYHTYVRPAPRRPTHKMVHGREAHVELDRLEQRRKLREYGLQEGKRLFHVRLSSERLGLEGVLDLLIESPRGLYPVEFKYSTSEPGLNHKYQLAAYALLAEEAFDRPIHTGFIYLIPGKRVRAVPITANVRLHLLRTLGAIRRLIREERMPEVPRSLARCRDCEYRRFCGDIDKRGRERIVLLVGGGAPRAAERPFAEGSGDGDRG